MTSLQAHHTELYSVQRTRKAVLLGAIVVCIALLGFTDTRWPAGTLMHEAIEWGGIALLVTAILGRTWCSLYIGGRKVNNLVATGPYSVTRNPLYVFSILGAVGAGAQMGSLVLALLAGFLVYSVFLLVVFREERVLKQVLGAAYEDYLQRVPRFFPKFSLWRDAEVLEVQPKRVATTFFDGLFFLLAIPIAEGVAYLHAANLLPALVHLP